MGEPSEPEEPDVPITDEGSQRQLDLLAIYQNLQAHRNELAGLKISYFLVRAGVKGLGQHPKQLAEAIAEKRKLIDALIAMGKDLETHGDSQIPEPEVQGLVLDVAK